MGREDYPAAELVHATVWRFGGYIPGGNGMPVRGQHPCEGAWGQNHCIAQQFQSWEIQQGTDSKSTKKKKKKKFWNLALERYYMGNEKDVLAGVFSYRNEHDREGDALTIMKS